MVRHTLAVLGPKVLASRMVRDYTTELYAPAAQSFTAAVADDYAAARDLAAYRRRVEAAWPSVMIAGLDESGDPGAQQLHLTAQVGLGGMAADEVTVEAVLGRVDDAGDIVEPTVSPMSPTGGPDALGRVAFTTTVTPHRSGVLGYTARVLPRQLLLADDAELGLVRYPAPAGG